MLRGALRVDAERLAASGRGLVRRQRETRDNGDGNNDKNDIRNPWRVEKKFPKKYYTQDRTAASRRAGDLAAAVIMIGNNSTIYYCKLYRYVYYASRCWIPETVVRHIANIYIYILFMYTPPTQNIITQNKCAPLSVAAAYDVS